MTEKTGGLEGSAPAATREGLLLAGVYGTPEQITGHSTLEPPTNVESVLLSGETQIGAWTYFNAQCEMTDASIGRYCSIGQNVLINPREPVLGGLTTHPLAWDRDGGEVGTMATSPDYRQTVFTGPGDPGKQRPVVIEHDVWIGARAVIASGVKIGTGAVIGANSLVQDDVEPYTIVAGSPARVIRRRFDDATIARLMASRWWEYDLSALPERDYSDIPVFLDRLEALKAGGEARSYAQPSVVVERERLVASRLLIYASRASSWLRRLHRWTRRAG
jgi:acetyltransferase-like isoleucine patch superfamily enzyme